MDQKEQLLRALHKKGVQSDLAFTFRYKGQKVKKNVGDIMELFFLQSYTNEDYQQMIEDIESLNHEAAMNWVWGIGFGQILQEKVETKDRKLIKGLVATIMSGRKVTFSIKQKGIKQKCSAVIKGDHVELNYDAKKVEKLTIQQIMEFLLYCSGRLDDIPNEVFDINTQQNIIH